MKTSILLSSFFKSISTLCFMLNENSLASIAEIRIAIAGKEMQLLCSLLPGHTHLCIL